MTLGSAKVADASGCTVLQGLATDAQSTGLAGQALEIEFRRFAANEALQASQDRAQHEEVSVVLSGRCEILAHDERYLLSEGEGIVLPPGARGLWRCVQGPGVLYRVWARDAGADSGR